MTRSKALAGVAGVAVVSLAAGLYFGSRLTSPADAAARVEPPEAGDVTVEVEHRVLRSEVVGRGDASYAGAVSVKLELTAGGRAVVTGQVPKEGSQVDEGDVLLEVVGRPVIALQGVLPMYRSLEVGMSGPDVEQLEQTLSRLGIDPGTVDDEYDLGTAAAVRALYDRAGYPAPEPTGPKRRGQTRTPLPSAEVVYISSLPRRVDDVKVSRGGEVTGPVMSVSGANLVVSMPVDLAAGKLLRKGMTARIALPSGGTARGEVTSVQRDGDEYRVKIAPRGLTDAQRTDLREANVRVTVPVRSSKGKVLAVPLAALSAGPDGSTRVEVSRDGRLHRVPVRVGLTAAGYAEVTPLDGKLQPGDLVVVGAKP